MRHLDGAQLSAVIDREPGGRTSESWLSGSCPAPVPGIGAERIPGAPSAHPMTSVLARSLGKLAEVEGQ